MAPYLAGQLKATNIIWVMRLRLALGFEGASVLRPGCSLGRRGVHYRRCVVDFFTILLVRHDAVLDGMCRRQHPALLYASSSA